jgi:hypothetical protein
MKKLVLSLFLLIPTLCFSQTLKIKKRPLNALSGSEFSKSIRDTSINLDEREKIIFMEIKNGNIPDFYRQMVEIRDTLVINNNQHTIKYYVIPDFLAIGNEQDYFYCPMRPQLAQQLAKYLKCSLPTRKISNQIYQNASVKMLPQPIPPSKEMGTIPVFEKHNLMVKGQRKNSLEQFPNGNLVAGNKKDVVISNKIFNEKGLLRVVIYGWHKPDGKAIQPLYNGHSTIHVDYSHGIRLVQNKVWIDGKKTSIQKVLKSKILHPLLSDEGVIAKPYYPVDLY